MGEEQRPADVEGPTLCLLCANLQGCRHLADKKGKFIPERLITWDTVKETGNSTVCPDFERAGKLELEVRDNVLGLANGLVTVTALYYRKGLPIVEEEDEEEMIEDVPDFAAMLYDAGGELIGLTAPQREEQLRYQTDEYGNLISDDENDGQKIPRGSFPIRKYAENPDGPIAPRISESLKIEVDQVPNVIRFWKTNELVQAIINAEHASGLIIKDNKKRAPAPDKAKANNIEKETQMPPKKIQINRQGAAKDEPAAAPAKKAVPATNKKMPPKKPGQAAAPAADPEPAASPAPKKAGAAPGKAKTAGGGGTAAAGKGGDGDVAALLKTLINKVDALDAKIDEKTEALDTQVQTCATLLHDATLQTMFSIAGGLAFALHEINPESSQHVFETVPTHNDEVKPDARNLMSGPDGERNSILIYLDQVGGGEEGGGEEAGEDEPAGDDENS